MKYRDAHERNDFKLCLLFKGTESHFYKYPWADKQAYIAGWYREKEAQQLQPLTIINNNTSASSTTAATNLYVQVEVPALPSFGSRQPYKSLYLCWKLIFVIMIISLTMANNSTHMQQYSHKHFV